MVEVSTIRRAAFLVLFAGALAAPAASHAQIGNRLKGKIQERVDRKADQAMDKALDKAEKGVECVVTDQDCINKAKAEGKEVTLTDAKGKPLPKESAEVKAANGAGGSKAHTQAPGQGAWANYDFVPGERVLFAEDFMQDRVGNFPRRLQFLKGNMEIVDVSGKRWLRTTADGGQFSLTLPEVLPQRFTMEFDATIPANWCSGVVFSEADMKAMVSGGAQCKAEAGSGWIGIATGANVGLGRGEGDWVASRNIEDLLGDFDRSAGSSGLPFHVRLQVDGEYAKLYVGETRVANVPTLKFPRTNKVFFNFQGGDDDRPLMITGITVNAGGRELYDALMADGQVTTQGILFDVGSDRLRPESTPTLKEIGEMLESHADLKLEIQGHTDNTGQAAANQTLSEKRAASVKAYLLQTYGIDGSRLTSKGYGDTKPVAKNDTPEGKQQNRRVVLVKL